MACSTVPTADENAVTKSAVLPVITVLSMSIQQVLTKNELLYCSR